MIKYAGAVSIVRIGQDDAALPRAVRCGGMKAEIVMKAYLAHFKWAIFDGDTMCAEHLSDLAVITRIEFIELDGFG